MIYCCCFFTESRLNEDVSIKSLLLDNFSVPFQKDGNNRGGGILVYINNKILCERMTELEISWAECLWIKIIQNQVSFLLDVFYSPKTSDLNFFNKFKVHPSGNRVFSNLCACDVREGYVSRQCC